MAFTEGMNVGEVRNQAQQLRVQADVIRNEVIGRINTILSTLEQNWRGKDMNDFKGWWESEHRPALTQLAERISGLAQSAENNASEQEAVSNR